MIASPIAVFVFNCPDNLTQSLAANEPADQIPCDHFCSGPRNEPAREQTYMVRAVVYSVQGGVQGRRI